jgi:hypothetical protein
LFETEENHASSITVSDVSADNGTQFLKIKSLEPYRYTNLLGITVSEQTAQGIPFVQHPSFK